MTDRFAGTYDNYLCVFSSMIMDVPSVLVELNEGSHPSFPAIAEALAIGVARYLGLVEPVVDASV